MTEPAGPFVLPDLDAPAATEVGVILLGLDAERLLAGLALAADGGDPGVLAARADRARHDGGPGFAALVDAGARRWREVRPALVAAGPDPHVSAALRRAWEAIARTVDAAVPVGAAERVYLTACWLRRHDIDAAT